MPTALFSLKFATFFTFFKLNQVFDINLFMENFLKINTKEDRTPPFSNNLDQPGQLYNFGLGKLFSKKSGLS